MKVANRHLIVATHTILGKKELKLVRIPTDNGFKKKFVPTSQQYCHIFTISNNIIIILYYNNMVVIFEHGNVQINRKKAKSKDYTRVGSKDNKVKVIAEDGNVYLKVFNPQTGLVYISSIIKSFANPELNLTNSKGVHLILLVPSLTPDPRAYIFVFDEEGVASRFNALISLAAKAATEEELLNDSETIGEASVN